MEQLSERFQGGGGGNRAFGIIKNEEERPEIVLKSDFVALQNGVWGRWKGFFVDYPC